VTFSNTPHPDLVPDQGGVVLTITHVLNAARDPSAGSSVFPLSMKKFQTAPGPGNNQLLNFRIEGIRYAAVLHIGDAARQSDVVSMQKLIGSIRPTAVGTISGHLYAAGGPVGGTRPLSGSIYFSMSIGPVAVSRWLGVVKVGSDGRYSVFVAPGVYSVSGWSPFYNAGKTRCQGQ